VGVLSARPSNVITVIVIRPRVVRPDDQFLVVQYREPVDDVRAQRRVDVAGQIFAAAMSADEWTHKKIKSNSN